MRGWVIAALLSFIGTSATPQCSYQLQYSGPYRASYFDLAVEGNDLWAATGYGLQLFDRTVDPPRSIDAMAIPALTRVVRASGGIAYAGSGTSIYVVRKAGPSLQLIGKVDAGGTVNDLALFSGSLFAATSNGIASFSLADPLQPQGGLTPAQTSTRNVLSVSVTTTELYAADSDSSVEVFNRSGQTLTTKNQLQGLPRSTSVRAMGSSVYVSDGQRTAVFQVGSTTKLAEFSFGTSSVIEAGGNLVYAAGTDRQLHALDIAVLEQPIELFETEVVPSSGTINRITALAQAGNRLFIAGGDTGLLSFDVSSFTSPYPLRSYGFGAKTSITSSATAVFTGDAGGGISQLSRSVSGAMTLLRRWSDQPSVVHDNAGDFLLTSSGTTLRCWTLSPATPALLSSVTLRSGARSAVLIGTTAFVLLDEGTLWSADLTQQSPVPARISTPGGPLSFLSRSTRGIAVAEITENGTTNVHYFGDVNTDAPPVTATIPGAATAIAMDDRRVAIFTFRGINIVDFGQSPAAVTVLPQSNTGVVSDMSISGNRLADLSGENVRVWNLMTGGVVRQFTLPTAGTALDLAPESDLVAVATPTGVVSLNLQTTSKQPALLAAISGNEYYRKAAASSRFLYLFDGRDADIFETTSAAPHLVGSINSPGVIDVAASESSVFTLSNSGDIGVYSADGTLIRTTNLNEGADVVPISIAAVRGAAWVSFTKGCLSTGCEKKTIVYDAQSLVPTATLQGAIVDVTVAGNRAYAIFDQPKELRIYQVADALHPAPVAARASEGDPASVAVSSGVVYALGDKLYAYFEPALSKIGEQFQSQTPASATRLLIDGGCALITGRATAAQGYSLTPGQWTLLRTFDLPGTARSIVMQNGRVVILTDYSVEVWSLSPSAKQPRRRATQ